MIFSVLFTSAKIACDVTMGRILVTSSITMGTSFYQVIQKIRDDFLVR